MFVLPFMSKFVFSVSFKLFSCCCGIVEVITDTLLMWHGPSFKIDNILFTLQPENT